MATVRPLGEAHQDGDGLHTQHHNDLAHYVNSAIVVNEGEGLTAASARTTLDAQQADADLTAIAGLSPTDGDVVQRTAGAWAARTPTQVAATLPADQAAGTASLRTLGTGAAQAAAGSHAAQHAAAGADPVTQPAILRRTADAYAATVTPDISTSDLLDVGTLTGNVTIANPTGSPVDGQVLRLRLAQDATGGRTVALGAAYVYGTDVTADLVPTDANARWVMMAMYHAGAAEWWVVSIVRGY